MPGASGDGTERKLGGRRLYTLRTVSVCTPRFNMSLSVRISRIALLFALLAAGSWYLLPEIAYRMSRAEAAPRPVAPRGELTEDEKLTISIFEAAKASVV